MSTELNRKKEALFRRSDDGQRKIHTKQAAPERGDDWTRGPWQDDADGGDHEVAGEAKPGDVHGVRPDRQGAGGAGARDHDRDSARGIRDGQAALRARGLSRARGLHQEHDHWRGADGRGGAGGVGAGRTDAADARAHSAGAAGGCTVDCGVPEQGGHGGEGRRGAARPGRVGVTRAIVEVPISW